MIFIQMDDEPKHIVGIVDFEVRGDNNRISLFTNAMKEPARIGNEIPGALRSLAKPKPLPVTQQLLLHAIKGTI